MKSIQVLLINHYLPPGYRRACPKLPCSSPLPPKLLLTSVTTYGEVLGEWLLAGVTKNSIASHTLDFVNTYFSHSPGGSKPNLRINLTYFFSAISETISGN